MITNSSLTIYHQGFDNTNKLETWTRYNYPKVWFFGGKGASINKGYDNANDVEIRLPYSENDLDINNFSVGDIIVKGTLTTNITEQSDLSNYEIYNITSIKNNNFGNNQHIHIGGK
jgi:hypothetical protein